MIHGTGTGESREILPMPIPWIKKGVGSRRGGRRVGQPTQRSWVKASTATAINGVATVT